LANSNCKHSSGGYLFTSVVSTHLADGKYVINGTDRWTKESLSDNLQYLKRIGLIKIDEVGIITFSGDDFDRIYSKYYSKKHGVSQRITDDPPDERAGYYLASTLSGTLGLPLSMFLENTDILDADIKDMVQLFMMDDDNEVKSLKNPFEIYPVLAFRYYISCFENFGKQAYPLISITLASPWYKVRNLLSYELNSEEPQTLTYKEKIDDAIQVLRSRALQLDGDIEYEIHLLPVPDSNILTNKLASSENETLKKEAFSFHYREMINSYYYEGKKEIALLHGEAALMCGEPETGMRANNLGYLFMSFDRLDLAKPLIEGSISMLKNDPDIFLPKYNLSIVMAKQNMLKEALKSLREIKQEAENISGANDECFCLFVPNLDSDGYLVYEEFFDIYLLDAVQKAITTLESLSSQN